MVVCQPQDTNQLLNLPVQTETKPVDNFKQIYLVDRTEEAGCLRVLEGVFAEVHLRPFAKCATVA